jgi:hypothetical protein
MSRIDRYKCHGGCDSAPSRSIADDAGEGFGSLAPSRLRSDQFFPLAVLLDLAEEG